MMFAEIVFWSAIALVAYAYAGYPLLVWALSRGRADAADARGAGAIDSGPHPMVSLVVAAYREETFIIERLNNALTQDYPSDRLEVIVGCDGHEDLTGDMAAAYPDDRVRVTVFPERRGKASVLNDCIPAAQGEIVVLSDANTLMHPMAIRRLVRHFTQPDVGGVCGRLILTDPVTGQNVDGLYWKYENFLKRCEGRLGALLGANGGIYAIRRELYEPLPANTIIDDFVIGMRIHAAGRRLLYDASALAFEETPPTLAAEFQRRARIGAGGFQSLCWLWQLLDPRRGWLAWAFLSHKVLRWFGPLFLAAALAANIALAGNPEYRIGLVIQGAFYLAAYCGARSSGQAAWLKPLRLAAMFVELNLAFGVGFWRWSRGIRTGTWKRTERPSELEVTAS